jgi:hypothetical protein
MLRRKVYNRRQNTNRKKYAIVVLLLIIWTSSFIYISSGEPKIIKESLTIKEEPINNKKNGKK